MDPFTLSLLAGGAGSLFSIFGASQQRKAIERQKRFQIQAARVRADQLTSRLGRESQRAIGQATTSAAERNVFGRSSDRARLALTSEALEEQAAINLNEFIQIGGIEASANAQKPSLLGAAISGATAGISLGSSISSFNNKNTTRTAGQTQTSIIPGSIPSDNRLIPVIPVF